MTRAELQMMEILIRDIPKIADSLQAVNAQLMAIAKELERKNDREELIAKNQNCRAKLRAHEN